MRKLLLLLALLGGLASAQQVNQDIIPASTGLSLGVPNQTWNASLNNVVIYGTCTYGLAGVPCSAQPIGSFTIANLPTNLPVGALAVANDGLIAGSCTTGGGSNVTLCYWNGSTWQPLSSTAGGGSQCLVSTASGSDVGAKVAGCITSIGSNGTVRIDQGGTWSTQVTVPSGVNVVLDAKAGNITNGMSSRTPILLMNSNTSLKCDSWSNTIGAPTSGDETIVCGKDQGASCSSTNSTISNVRVNGCHFASQGSTGSSLDGAIWLENCVRCETNNNFFDGIATIGVLLGASSGTGNRSQYYSVLGNIFKGGSSVPLAVINAEHYNLGDNYFHNHGVSASGDIDIEPNASTDFAEDGDIHDNIIDSTDSQASFVDYGIIFQCGGFTHCMHNRVHDNLLWGGEPGGTAKFQQGIQTENSYMDVYNNTITNVNFFGAAIQVSGDHGHIYNNNVMCGPFVVIGVNGSQLAANNVIEHNNISTNNCGYSAPNAQQMGSIAEGANVSANIYHDNNGVVSHFLTSGSNSIVIGDPQQDGTSQTFHVPFGASNGISGSLSVAQLAAPSGLTKGTTAPSCTLASNTYFYKVTATDSLGETTPSGEINFATGGATCNYIFWTKVPGAKCYNIYRSTTTNTELKIDSICNGATSYPDIGGQTPTSSLPTNNTTGLVKAPVGLTGSVSYGLGEIVTGMWSSGSHVIDFSTNSTDVLQIDANKVVHVCCASGGGQINIDNASIGSNVGSLLRDTTTGGVILSSAVGDDSLNAGGTAGDIQLVTLNTGKVVSLRGSNFTTVDKSAKADELGLIRWNTCKISGDVSLTVNTPNSFCSWSLPAIAKTWGWTCDIQWTITAGTGTNNFAVGVNASQTPTATTNGIAQVYTATTGTQTYGSAAISASGATNLLTGATYTPAATVQLAHTSGTIAASGTAGTFAVTAAANGTTATAAVKAGSTCMLY